MEIGELPVRLPYVQVTAACCFACWKLQMRRSIGSWPSLMLTFSPWEEGIDFMVPSRQLINIHCHQRLCEILIPKVSTRSNQGGHRGFHQKKIPVTVTCPLWSCLKLTLFWNEQLVRDLHQRYTSRQNRIAGDNLFRYVSCNQDVPLQAIDNDNSVGYTSYWLGSKYRRQGFMVD